MFRLVCQDAAMPAVLCATMHVSCSLFVRVNAKANPLAAMQQPLGDLLFEPGHAAGSMRSGRPVEVCAPTLPLVLQPQSRGVQNVAERPP